MRKFFLSIALALVLVGTAVSSADARWRRGGYYTYPAYNYYYTPGYTYYGPSYYYPTWYGWRR